MKKRQTAKRKKPWGVHAKEMRPMMIRLPEDLRAWLDDTAAQFRLSRDAFMRIQLSNMREGFKAAAAAGTDEQALFQAFESKLVAATERAVKEAVADTSRRSKLGR